MAEEPEGTLEKAQARAEGRSFLGQVRLWGGVGAITLLAVFLLQNRGDAEVNFLWLDWDGPLIFALIASAILGAFATMVVGFFRGRARAATIRDEVRLARERETKP